MATSLLIIDDEPKMCSVLARMLERDGYDVEWSDDPRRAVELLDSRVFDIVLCDLRMPGLSGIDVLEHVKKGGADTDFVMMTAYATPQTAVESMKKGAIDYLIKPFAIDDLRALIKRIEAVRGAGEVDGERVLDADGVESGALASNKGGSGESASPLSAVSGDVGGIDFVAESGVMREVIERIKKVAGSDASVLLRGESGTGKEVIARMIHGLSRRAGGPLVAVNCGAIPESLMESELFGHVKGSFTGAIENRTGLFEAADNGTVFLDEIGELPLYLQVKLLRVLQEGEIQRVGESQQRRVNVRVIAATNRDLEADVARGDFRTDLYYRLNVIPVMLPPLRERRSDLPPLVAHFLRKFTAEGSEPPRLSPEAERLLMDYDYPGNIRELENAIEHAVVLSDGVMIRPDDLPIQIRDADLNELMGAAGGVGEGVAGGLGGVIDDGSGASHLERVEIALIMQALEKSQYNFTRAAQHLGITRRTLGYRINKYGLYEQIMRQKNAAGRGGGK